MFINSILLIHRKFLRRCPPSTPPLSAPERYNLDTDFMAYDNFKLIRKLSPIVNIINQLTCRCVDRVNNKKEKRKKPISITTQASQTHQKCL